MSTAGDNATVQSLGFIKNVEHLPPFHRPTFAVYLMCSILIFPVYLHVFNKKEQKSGKKSAANSTIHHFHWVLKIFKFCVYSSSILIVILEFYKLQMLDYLTSVYIQLWVVLTSLSVEVHQHLLSLLAIQRFALFFFPGTEKYWSVSPKTIRSVIYGLAAIQVLVIAYLKLETEYRIADNFMMVYYASVNSVFLVSALLYIPIHSAQLSQPQRFVMWQLIVIVVVKSVYILIFLYTRNNTLEALTFAKLTDAFLVPLVVQLTYLACNKGVSESAILVVKLKKAFGAVQRSSNAVHFEARANAVSVE